MTPKISFTPGSLLLFAHGWRWVNSHGLVFVLSISASTFWIWVSGEMMLPKGEHRRLRGWIRGDRFCGRRLDWQQWRRHSLCSIADEAHRRLAATGRGGRGSSHLDGGFSSRVESDVRSPWDVWYYYIHARAYILISRSSAELLSGHNEKEVNLTSNSPLGVLNYLSYFLVLICLDPALTLIIELSVHTSSFPVLISSFQILREYKHHRRVANSFVWKMGKGRFAP